MPRGCVCVCGGGTRNNLHSKSQSAANDSGPVEGPKQKVTQSEIRIQCWHIGHRVVQLSHRWKKEEVGQKDMWEEGERHQLPICKEGEEAENGNHHLF